MFSHQIEFVWVFMSVRKKTSKWCFILFWLLNCIKKNTYREINFLVFVENLEDNICWTLVNHLSFTFSVQKPTSSRISFFSKTCIYFFLKKEQKAKRTRTLYLAWAHEYQCHLHAWGFFWSRMETASLQRWWHLLTNANYDERQPQIKYHKDKRSSWKRTPLHLL